MGSDDFKILKFKVTQMFLIAKVMGRGWWEERSWHLCREGMPITMSLSWDLAGDITQQKGANAVRCGSRTGQQIYEPLA